MEKSPFQEVPPLVSICIPAFNVGQFVKTSLDSVFAQTGFAPKNLNFDLTKPVGVFSRAADLTHTRAQLDWEPATSFVEGLQRTIDWYTRSHDRKQVAARLGVLLMERLMGGGGFGDGFTAPNDRIATQPCKNLN